MIYQRNCQSDFKARLINGTRKMHLIWWGKRTNLLLYTLNCFQFNYLLEFIWTRKRITQKRIIKIDIKLSPQTFIHSFMVSLKKFLKHEKYRWRTGYKVERKVRKYADGGSWFISFVSKLRMLEFERFPEPVKAT